jgi:hypothetical protein
MSVGVFRLWIGGFFIYVIADFMEYNYIKFILLNGQLGLLNISGLLIISGFIADIIIMFNVSRKIEKHKEYFYKRLKK